MPKILDFFSNNREKGETTYLVDDFEGAAFRFTPAKDSYVVFIKWKGRPEKAVDKTLKIVAEVLLGGKIISKEEYNSY